MCNTIILASSLFGSVYIFCKSLELTNKLLENNKIHYKLMIINSLSLLLSGSIFVYYSVNLIKLPHYKYVK
jgi:hypothetical protein